MGTYNYRNVPLNDIVAGFGTSQSVNGFSTEEINSKLKIDGVPARAIVKDPTTMPFSNLSFTGYRIGNSSVRWQNFAQSNFFIYSTSPRYSDYWPRGSTKSKTTIYYQETDSNRKVGNLYMGEPTYSNIILSNCPQVVLFAFQGCGGSGGGAAARLVWVNDYWLFGWHGHYNRYGAGGGGGGGGAFSCFQVNMNPNQSSRAVPVLSFEITSDHTIYIYPANDNNVVMSIGSGTNGGDGTIDGDNRPTAGRGGKLGQGIEYALPSNWRHVYNTFSITTKGYGGDGGWSNPDKVINSGGSPGGGFDSTRVTVNSASNGYITGAEGRSGWTNYPEECIVPNGGGGGAMLEMGRGGSGGASSGTFSDPHYSDSHYQLNIYY